VLCSRQEELSLLLAPHFRRSPLARAPTSGGAFSLARAPTSHAFYTHTDRFFLLLFLYSFTSFSFTILLLYCHITRLAA